MVVRIRFALGPKLGSKRAEKTSKTAALATLASASVFTPAAVVASAFALWRIAADLKFTNSFAIPSGFFSHWQVWLAMAIILQLCSRVLNRFGKNGNAATS